MSDSAEPDLVYSLYQQGRQRLDGGDPGGAAEVLELAVAREPAMASLHETALDRVLDRLNRNQRAD